MKNNQLHVGIPFGESLELYPESFQPNDSGRTSVNVRYKVKGNLVSFEADDYDHSKTLVIDPTLQFCSFTGSKGDNWGLHRYVWSGWQHVLGRNYPERVPDNGSGLRSDLEWNGGPECLPPGRGDY